MSMKERHTTAAERALYVLDALAVDERERIEEHIISCPTCHTHILAEARIEVTLQALCSPPPAKVDLAPPVPPWPVEANRPVPVRFARGNWIRLAIAALPAAAALVLVLRFGPNSPPQPGAVLAGPADSARRELLLTAPTPDPDEALACNQPAAREYPAETGTEEPTCALPPVAACAELLRSCGPTP